MKYLFLSLALFFSIGSIAQKNDEVTSVIVKFFDGLSELNDKKIASTVTKNFLLLEDGEVWTLDTLLVNIAPARQVDFKRENFFDFFDVRISGNAAWVSYHNRAEFRINGNSRTVKWLESAVLSRNDGSWKIELLHSTMEK